MTNTEVVKKLIGSIAPAGATHIDKDRLLNLTEMCVLIHDLTIEVVRVADAIESQEHSVKEMGEYATGFLAELSELITKGEDVDPIDLRGATITRH